MMKFYILGVAAASMVALMVPAGCGGSSNSGPTCTPNATQSCSCPGGGTGSQTCSVYGGAFSPCVCGGGGSAGSGGGGSGGSGDEDSGGSGDRDSGGSGDSGGGDDAPDDVDIDAGCEPAGEPCSSPSDCCQSGPTQANGATCLSNDNL